MSKSSCCDDHSSSLLSRQNSTKALNFLKEVKGEVHSVFN